MIQSCVHGKLWGLKTPEKKLDYRGLTVKPTRQSNGIVRALLLTAVVAVIALWVGHQTQCLRKALQTEGREYGYYTGGGK